MALSPFYGWSEPDNSSLVKNGAADIRTLGDAIDTSVWNIGYGQAGKNKIINGDFNVWQRGTSGTVSANETYTADRWLVNSGTGGVISWSRQAFTPGQTDVPDNPTYFLRSQYTTSGTTPVLFETHLEDVTLFAGQTATYSFYAKINTGTKSVVPRSVQSFGSGGSSTVVTNYTAVTLTTTWTRFTVTMAIPSITGKTVGTSSFLRIDLTPQDSSSGTLTYDFARPQLEYGSKATPFQTATGSIQGELAACQRYYEKSYDQGTAPATATLNGIHWASGSAASPTTSYLNTPLRYSVTKRVAPTLTFYDGAGTANVCTRSTLGVGDNNGQSVTAGQNGTSGANIYSTGTSNTTFFFHYVASAEL